jgi:hypothetical protein
MSNVVLNPPGATKTVPRYWETRKEMMYYKYIDVLVRAFAADARSLIDVGARNTPVAEAFDWIPERAALDLWAPYHSPRVRGIQADFLLYVPERRFDFALCLQVLEHIPAAPQFARHLFEVAEHVLVSVPYQWRQGSNPHHVHDPVSLEKLVGWMGRPPSYDVVVTEPLSKTRRLIAYFPSPASKFSLAAVRDRLIQGPRGAEPAP